MGENVNLILRYQLGEMRVGDERFGPGQLIMELRHLDAAALVKFKNEMDDLYRGNLPPPQAAMMLAAKGLELIGTLAKKAPELEITRLSIKTREGEISGRAKFGIFGDGKEVARNTLENTTPITFPEDETFDVGADTRTGVAMLEYRYDPPFRFTGRIDKLTFDLATTR